MSLKDAVLALLGAKASQELKNLLENKHLYQSVSINPAEILKQQLAQENQPNLKKILSDWSTQELPKLPFRLSQQPQQQVFAVPRGATQRETVLTLALLNPSLFCRKCGRRQAYAPVVCSDVVTEVRRMIASGEPKPATIPDGFQMFLLVYQCQQCWGALEGFLIRREAWTLGLHGRSPIEFVEIPTYIPKLESVFYRDAIIAFSSGKILAALYYLRTFIEQFARRLTGRTGRVAGDEILDEYNKTLPSPTKDQMPSLREWYDKLSDALHSAREDAELFEKAKTEIDRHFDIRRVFKMSEEKPVEVAEAKPASGGPESNTTP